MSIPLFTTTPNSVTSPTTFDTDSDQYHAELNPVITAMNGAITTMNSQSGTAAAASSTAVAALGSAQVAALTATNMAQLTALDRTQTGLDAAAAAASATAALAAANSMVTVNAAGTVDAITVDTPGAAWALTDGRAMLVKFLGANTISGVTVGVDATTVKPLRRGLNQPLQVGDTAGSGLIRYSTASGGYYELMNPGVAISLATVIEYDNRATLRASGSTGYSVYVNLLGTFVFVTASSMLDDDETCFAATGGCWEMKACAPEYVLAQGLVAADDAVSAAAEKTLTTTFNQAVTSIATITSTSAVTVALPGAAIGDSVKITPNGSIGLATITAWVSNAGVVSYILSNASAGTTTITAGNWTAQLTK